MVVERMETKCLGMYCGRTVYASGNLSDCNACASGYRANANSICQKCDSQPTFYDWMYLVFMFLIPLGLHWFFIDVTNRQKSSRLLALHISAFLECAMAAIGAILVLEPVGQLALISCPVMQLSDWYTLFHNPTPDYVHITYCTQEAVYPIYTVVFIYNAFSLLLMLILRPITHKLIRNSISSSVYAALYFFPVLTCVHAVMAGFVYYSFPYLVITISLLTNVVHLSQFDPQGVVELLRSHVTKLRSFIVLIGHWMFHAFGIIALTQLRDLSINATLLCLVPLPTLFYIVTVRFTDPSNLDIV